MTLIFNLTQSSCRFYDSLLKLATPRTEFHRLESRARLPINRTCGADRSSGLNIYVLEAPL